MDFSKNYLAKYGWKEGQGLGKTRSGIKDAIKPKLKFDKAGVGFDPSKEFTDHWWEKVYNDALKKKKQSSINETEWLAESEETSLDCNFLKQDEQKLEKDYNGLFKACEGRTAHKGARHGLQLSGKLQRLEQQEEMLLGKKCKKRESKPALENDVNKKPKYSQDKIKHSMKKCNKKDQTKQNLVNR